MWMIKNTRLGRWIFTFFKRRTPKIKDKVNELDIEYRKLIHEYRLIQEKKSSLSRAERDQVQARVLHLIGKGHIQIN